MKESKFSIKNLFEYESLNLCIKVLNELVFEKDTDSCFSLQFKKETRKFMRYSV